MNKFYFVLITSSLIACNAGEDKAKVESMAATADSSKKETVAVTYPYNIDYSSSFEIGDAAQARMLLELWKDWDNNTLAMSGSKFADSVNLNFADGTNISGPKDSVIAISQRYRDMFSKVESSVSAVIPLKSTDKNENWVTVWGKEVYTDKKGKTDSSFLQETWRFNKEGKVDLLYQYRAKPQPPAKK